MNGEMDRRQFLKGCAGIAALAAWSCKRGGSVPANTRIIPEKAAYSGSLEFRETVLRADGKPYKVKVECWNGAPIGIRGRASAALLDLLPLYWGGGWIDTPLLRGRPVADSVIQAELMGIFRTAELRRKPLLVVVPPLSGIGLMGLLRLGSESGALKVLVESGRNTQTPYYYSSFISSTNWEEALEQMRSGRLGGMLVLGLYEAGAQDVSMRECWTLAEWKGTLGHGDSRWVKDAQMVLPMPHPFQRKEKHRLPGNEFAWQTPVVDNMNNTREGLELLLNALPGMDGNTVRWNDWLDMRSEEKVDFSETTSESGVPSLQSISLELPRSPWFTESRASMVAGAAEPIPVLVPAEVPAISTGKRWGMIVDLDLCTQCGACVMACMLENNVPVVGEKEFTKGRGMQWLRLVRGVPIMCQHCTKAPCEAACPVGATSHSSDGLNEQTYARCIGARYCAIHCPWQTRRFGFGVLASEGIQMQFNPRVPLRPQGVMEKCTFCVQRLRDAHSGGEIVSACAEACPVGALLFGDWNASSSSIRRAAEGRGIWRLSSLGSEGPAVFYLRGRR